MLVTDFLSRVMPSVMGCPIPIATMAILDSVDELCRESRVLREAQSIPVISGTDQYAITPVTAGAFAVEVLFARIDDADPLELITPDLLNRIVTTTSAPIYIEQVSSGMVRLHPEPSLPGSMALTVVLSVLSNATTVPAPLDRWRDGIVGGALARLMAMPNQPWANPQAATGYRQVFNQAVDSATTFATLGGARATLRVQPQP